MARPTSDLPEIQSTESDDVDLDDLAAIVATTAQRPAGAAPAETEMTREFWGAAPGWRPTGSVRAVRPGDSGRTGRVSRTGPIERTRTHRTVTSGEQPAHDELAAPALRSPAAPALRSPATPARDTFDTFDVTGLHTPTPPPPPRHASPPEIEVEVAEHGASGPLDRFAARIGLGAVDPLVLRIGLVVLIVALLVPFALALRSDETPTDVVRDSPVGAVVAPRPVTAAAPGVEATTTAGGVEAIESTPATESAPGISGSDSSDAAATAPATTVPPTPALVAPAVVDVEAERIEPVCGATYEAAEGDYWIRLADEAGISLGDLLDANGATTSTPLYPGSDVCLPPGAAMPSPPPPPTTAAPATTAAPTTTVRPAAAPAPAPTTTAAPRPAPASTDQVQAMIREIWPDELEEKALQIAFRESRYQATAYNGWCCYGVFQIHWNAHKGWLAGIGITSSQQLLDARTNIQVAYTIYQRAGGWGPWGG